MRKYFIVPAILLALVISCSSPREAGKSQYEKGMAALVAGQTEKALDIFSSAASKYPESPDARMGMVSYYENEQFIYEALDACSKIVRDFPDYTPALQTNARLCLEIDRPELTYFFSSLYRDAGGDEVVASLLETRSFLASGRITEALETVEKALANMPDNKSLLIARARCEMHSGNINEAFENMARVIESGNFSISLLTDIGDFYKETGLFDSAAIYYDKALDKITGGGFYYLKAGIIEKFIEMNYLHRARQMMTSYADHFPASNIYYILESKCFEKQKKIREADQSYGMIVPNHSKSPSVMSRFSRLRQKMGDDFASERYFETATLLTRDTLANIADIALKLSFVDLLFDLGQFKNATPVVKKLMDSLPNDFHALYDGCYLSMMFDDKMQMHDMLMAIKPTIKNNPAYMAKLSEIYILSDSFKVARDLLMEAVGMDKLNTTAILQLVRAAREQNLPQEGLSVINSFDEYVSYQPEIAEAKLMLYDSLGEFNSGLQFAEQLIEVGKEDIERYRRAAEFALKLRKPERAAEIYQMCIDNNPEDPAAYILAGEYYYGKGDLEKTGALVKQALDLDSLQQEALIIKGKMAAGDGKTDEAIEIFNKVIGLNQYASDAIGELAIQEIVRGDNPQIAINHAMKAIMYDGGNARHRTTLGRAYYAQGKYKIAMNSFHEALKMDPENPLINYYAGLNFAKMSDTKFEAKMHLQKAIKDGLPGELAEEARKVVKSL